MWVVDRFETVEGIEAFVVKSGSRDSFYRVSDGANFLERVNSVVEVRYTPPVIMMLFPLEVGKTWSPSYTRELLLARQTEDMLLDCRVDSEASVTVPAGTFQTFHIICLNHRTGNLNFERWYAPEVGNMVKERSSFTYGIRERELLGFKRAERRQ